MRKLLGSIIGIIILIILFLVLGMPFIFGLSVQRNYPALLTHLTQNPDIKIKLINYHRGWFSSSSLLQVEMYGQIPNPNNPLQLNQELLTQFKVNQIIHHGPIVYASLTDNSHKLLLGRAVAENKINDTAMKFNAFTVWTFNNHINTLISSPLLQIDTDQQRLIARSLNGNIDYDVDHHHLKGNIGLAGMEFWVRPTADTKTPFLKTLEFHNFNTMSDTSEHENGLWYGTSSITVGKALLYPSKGNASITSLENLALNINQTTMNDKTSAVIGTTIDQINNNQVHLKKINIQLNLNDLDNVALGELNQAVQNNKPIYAAMFDLLAGGFNINLSQFNFETEDGPAQLQAELQFPSQIQKTANPLYWFKAYKKLLVKANLHVPRLWLHKWLVSYYQQKAQLQTEPGATNIDPQVVSNQQINYWLQNNIVQQQGNQYAIKLDISEGNILLNGAKPKVTEFFINPQQNMEQPPAIINKLNTPDQNSKETGEGK